MRKEASKNQNVTVARVQGYHSRTTTGNYAYQGFEGGVAYLNSDRALPVHEADGILYRDDGQAIVAGGIEVEVQCNGIHNSNALAEVFEKIITPKFKFGRKQWKMQSDCSLGGRSNLEYISNLCTKGRFRNDYAAYKTMFDVYFPAFGISADSYTTTCGMHINFSNAVFGKTEEQQLDAIRKLAYFVNHNYNLCCKLFYRSPERTRYCGRMSELDNKDYCKTLNPNNYYTDHGVCLNLGHYREGRIELRLVGGQANYYCFRNTMETAWFLAERIGKVSWNDIDDMYKVFRGCNQYVVKRLADCVSYIGDDTFRKLQECMKPEDLELHR